MMDIDDILDHDDFFGVVFQHWHIAGDERQPIGNPGFFPREFGGEFLRAALLQGDGSEPSYTTRAVFTHPAA